MKKMKSLLEDIALNSEPKVNKFEVIEGVSQYSMLGSKLYNENIFLFNPLINKPLIL